MDEAKKRDYKAEYKKFQSSTKMKKYRAELNKYNRQKGTYGNGDKKDASHKGGKIVGFENQSKNRGRAEKSRLKKESKIVESLWNYIKEGDELQRWKVYIKGEKKPLILTGKDKNSVKKFAHQMIHNNKVKIVKVVKEGILKESFQKRHFLNLIKQEIDSLKGQIAYSNDKVNYKGTPDWEKKEFKAVLKDLKKKLKDTEKHYKRVEKLKEGLELTESKQKYVVGLTSGDVISGDKAVSEKKALQIMSRIARQSDGWVNPFMIGVEYWNGTHPKRKGKPHKANKKKIMVKEEKLKEGINVRKWIKAIEKGEDVVVYDKKGKRYNLQGGNNKEVQVTDHWEDAGRRNVHPESTWQTLPLSKVKKIVSEEKLNEFGTSVNIDLGASSYIHPDRKEDVSNQGVYLQGFSNSEARQIIDGNLKKWVKSLRKVEHQVIKDWMKGAKSGSIDFFDIIRGLKTGDIRRAHPFEVEFLTKILNRNKIIDRFRSYFKGKKGKPGRTK